jgi:hypothetical protein
MWPWERLVALFEPDGLVYFPRQYGEAHGGILKSEMVEDGRCCGVPGWSVGLVEAHARLPLPGEGRLLAGRAQLEIGMSPRQYLAPLHDPSHGGESGRTLEDFLTAFLLRLVETNDVSHDRADRNALWLLGAYVPGMESVRSDLVPTGWWHRGFGRLRLDAHRPGNRTCTAAWGAATTVRLPATSC